ncbi:MAG: hypothetical protein JNK63_06690 [Chthonomonas sp.]|nr:hypothetical protein [Chthonomonas sp.]
MATLDDLATTALSLPGIVQNGNAFEVEVRGKMKGICWVWLERLEPKKARVPNPRFWAISTASLSAREVIEQTDPEFFIHDPHYNNYPAVVVELAKVPNDILRDLLIEAWRSKAPKALQQSHPEI